MTVMTLMPQAHSCGAWGGGSGRARRGVHPPPPCSVIDIEHSMIRSAVVDSGSYFVAKLGVVEYVCDRAGSGVLPVLLLVKLHPQPVDLPLQAADQFDLRILLLIRRRQDAGVAI